jgi:hypothetical protein
MRTHYTLALVVAAACGNNPDPRMITGGGVGDGDIDGTLNVYVIDNITYQPIVDATVEVGGTEQQTDDTGLVIFADLSGAQTVSVKANGYRGAVWQGANGANMTIPVTKLGNVTAQQANLSGTLAGWDTVSVVGTGHVKAALVAYSQSDDLGDPENNIKTPGNLNACFGTAPCNFTVATRTGTVTLIAAIIDYDTKNTQDNSDDVLTIIGWATAPSLQVDAGIAQTGITLTMVDAAMLQTATIDFGTPPSSLPKQAALVGIELSKDEVVQFPVLPVGATSVLVPQTSVFAPNATYRLTAISQTTDGDLGAQSVVLRRGLASATLTAGTWLEPPANVSASRDKASFDAVSGAKLSSVQWSDANGVILEITQFDTAKTSVDVPALLALPTTGTLTAKAQALGADIDVKNFSLDTDKKKLWGVGALPVTIN